jgi:hypothetical protein
MKNLAVEGDVFRCEFGISDVTHATQESEWKFQYEYFGKIISYSLRICGFKSNKCMHK